MTQVFLDLSNQDGSYGTGIGASYIDQFEAVPNYSTAGVLSLELTGVTPGTYNFDAGAASSAVCVPEPSSVLLLSTGLLGLIGSGMSFRKRFI